jgi:phosphate-selective porin OprO and OprP
MNASCLGAFLLVWASASFAAADDEGGKKPSPPAAPPTEDQRRIERLEKELEALKAERPAKDSGLPPRMSLDQDKKEPAKPDDLEFRASFTDGFHLRTTDGSFDLHVGGRWLEEYRYTFNRRSDGAVRTSTNTFYAREMFLSMDGTLFHDFGFKVNGDFSQNQTAGVTTGAPAGTTVSTGAIIEEAWVEWKSFKEFRLMFGSFKAPASFEITDSPRFAKLIQRSPMARFLPNLDTGIKAYGNFIDNTIMYELAVTNGRSHLANTGRGNTDDNDGKEYDGRLSIAPFASDKTSPFRHFRVGVYGTFAHVGQGSGISPTGWPGNISTNELAVNYYQFPAGSVRFAGDRYRVGAEATFTYGPAMIRGEFMTRNDELIDLAGVGTGQHSLLRTVGYYVEGSVLLTGEDEAPNGRVIPKHPFNIKEGTWGAFELVGRFGAVSMDRSVLEDLGSTFPGANSNRVSSITVGFWWWPIQNVRFGLNYIGENYYSGVQLSGTHHGSHVNGVLARFQVDF